MTEEVINSDVKRTTFFSTLLERADRSEQFSALADLLLVWPALAALHDRCELASLTIIV